MQTTSNATLFQTSYSEALGAYRARKAVHTSGLVSPTDSSSSLTANERYGYPIHLNPNFGTAVVENPDDLAVEGSGADGGRYRVLEMKVEGGWIWTSEAGGVVRQMDVESGVVRAVYRGAKAPVPGFDFITTEGGGKLLITGSWDRAIRVYRVVDRNDDDDKVVYPAPVLTLPNAMNDFIKCVHVFLSDGQPYIATAGSDKSIVVWDASPLLTGTPTTLRSLHQSKPHLRPINTLSSLTTLRGTTHLYSADSMGRILEHTLNPTTLRLEILREIQGFSTAIYDLKLGFARVDESDSAHWKEDEFVSEVKEDDEGERFRLVGEIWACSGDKSAAGYRLSPSLQNPSSKTSSKTIPLGTQPPLSTPYIHLAHPDFVKSILPLPLFPTTPPLPHIITGGSDEHLHVYPSPSSTRILIEAHWHEITSLALYSRPPNPHSTILPTSDKTEIWIISASLDASIRRFNLSTLSALPKPQLVKPSPNDSSKPDQQHWDQYSIPPPTHSKLPTDDANQMTAEEEAELAELMDSDDN
ncbi:hypothetical protein PHBOTO_001869 [Pseudozyma hubeiensis]|nr:hypothetical protein PHBOTO_001869 [Pseudozyma hubeiensis]